MEQEWKEKKADEAKKERKLDTADHSNKQEELEQKATKPNKGEESSMENLGGSEGWGLYPNPHVTWIESGNGRKSR